MSETKENEIKPWYFQKGNKAASLSYGEKRIRDELKTNFYKAANFLNLTQDQAKEFILEIEAAKTGTISSNITVFEALVADAIVARKWDLIDRILDRMNIKSSSQSPEYESKTILDELSEEQKRNAIEAASKTLEEK